MNTIKVTQDLSANDTSPQKTGDLLSDQFRALTTGSTAEFERLEEATAAYAFHHIREGIKRYFECGRTRGFPDCLAETWQGASQESGPGSIRLYMPERFGKSLVYPPEFLALRIAVDLSAGKEGGAIDGTGASCGHGLIHLYYDPLDLEKAPNYQDQRVQNLVARLQYQLYHEATHLWTGKVGELASVRGRAWYEEPRESAEYRNGQMSYYTDPGEVKAHARQYAIIFMNRFPGQSYDQPLLVQLAHEMNDGKCLRFAKKLGTPGIQAQFPEFKNRMQHAHELFHDYMQRFVSPAGYRQYRPV